MSRTRELLTAAQAAAFLGMSRSTLTRWNNQGNGPPRVLKGLRYWYSRECLRQWLKHGAPPAEEFAPAVSPTRFFRGINATPQSRR